MKYLKKSAEVLIGKAGVQKSHLSDYTVTLVLPTHYSDGSGDDLLGIQVTRGHLEHLRNEIDRCLSETTEDKPEPESVELVNNLSFKAETGLAEAQLLGVFDQVSQQVKQMLQTRNQQKQTQLVIDPKLMMIIQHKPTGKPDSWSAKIHTLTGLKDFFANGRLELSVFADSEENARERLNIAFHNFIMACIYPDSSESRIPDIVRENQQPVSESYETKKADDKDSTPFKLNPDRVMSMKVGADKWEARTRFFNVNDGLTDLVATADSEETAREELDKKFSNLAGPMMNFIRFMSQDS